MVLPMGRSQGCLNLPTGLPSAHWEMWTLKLAWKQHQQALHSQEKSKCEDPSAHHSHSTQDLLHVMVLGQALETWHSAM